MFWRYIVLCIVILAIGYMVGCFVRLRRMNEGTKEMIEMAKIIRGGARTFMRTEYKTIVPVVLIVSVLFALFVEAGSGLTLIWGATMSSIACIIGMSSATYANVRTANAIRRTKSVGRAVKVALLGGSVSGVSVQAFGMFGVIIVLLIDWVSPTKTGSSLITKVECNPTIIRLTTYSLGCSLVAMFNRVAGGNYTKAADISADILAKIRHDMPEDDRRVPNVIADFIGDMVNDVAGNVSDLLESFVGAMAACPLIGIVIYNAALASGANITMETFNATCLYPILLSGGGLLSCIIGLFITPRRRMGDDPLHELNISTFISAGLTIIFSLIASRVMFSNIPLYDEFKLGWFSPWISSLYGIISGVAIGIITERYTSTKYKPTKAVAEIAIEGEAFVITKGDALGSRSCLVPALVIGISLILSGITSGIYGIAISALGMLSFVANTVSIDAFGPIADNAGGIIECCHLDSAFRKISDIIDSAGNITAAIGKGEAIGSASFATVSLIIAFIGSYVVSGFELSLNIANFVVMAGGIIGGALIEYFSAILTDNTIESARLMADEGDRQLTPEVISGKKDPNYNRCIELAAKQALKKMLFPSLIALLVPVVGGFIFGVEFVGGILVGATIVAIPRAIFMGNSGGAFDNAKKYIESGELIGHGKGSSAHKAAVTGDTVGDTRKDVVGVALDIFIKLMSTVANTLAPLMRNIALIRF